MSNTTSRTVRGGAWNSSHNRPVPYVIAAKAAAPVVFARMVRVNWFAGRKS